MLFSASKKDSAEVEPLRKYMQAMTAIGTGGYIFATTCGRQFIYIIWAEKWASDSCVALLQAYCLYCVFMALNGISEAYAFSKGAESTLKTLRWLMLFNTGIYVALSLVLSQQIGIVGLVYANCINMFIRTSTCIYFTFK